MTIMRRDGSLKRYNKRGRRKRCGAAETVTPLYLLPTGSKEREVLGVGSIPVAILPSIAL